jgi:EmrB/QacA subfamily drug resistance transporter
MTQSDPQDRYQFSRREIGSIMLGLLLALFLANLDQTIVATSLTTMARDLDGWALMPWVVSGYLISSTTTVPIYGKLSDLYGRRPVLLAAIGLFMGTSVLCALAQTMPQLVAARIMQGIGGGGLRAVAQAVVADMIPPRERGRYQGYFAGTYAVATTAGPVLGGYFTDYLSWHWIFWINLPIGAVAFLLSDRQLKRLKRPMRRPVIDWLGAVLILATSVPLLLGIGRVEQAGGWLRIDVLLPIAVGIAFLLLLILRERVAPDPMLPPRLFRDRTFSRASMASALANMTLTSLIVLIPLHFQLAGVHASDAGIRLIPLTVCTAIASMVTGSLVSRSGRTKIYPAIGVSGTMLVLATMSQVALGQSLLVDMCCTAALGFFFGSQFNPLTVMVQNTLRPEDTGVGVGTLTFLRQMAGAFGVALLTTLLVSALDRGVIAVPGHEVLGADPGLALLHVDQFADRLTPEIMAGFAASIRSAFSELYLVMAGVSLLTLIVILLLKPVVLRGYAKGGEDGKPDQPRQS